MKNLYFSFMPYPGIQTTEGNKINIFEIYISKHNFTTFILETERFVNLTNLDIRII